MNTSLSQRSPRPPTPRSSPRRLRAGSREAAAAGYERLAEDWEHHLLAIRIVVDALVWLVQGDAGSARKRAVTKELPALPGKTAALGA